MTCTFINTSGKSENRKTRPHADSEEEKDTTPGPDRRRRAQCHLFPTPSQGHRRADFWRAVANPSSHSEYEDEPLRRDISSIRVLARMAANATEAYERCARLFGGALDSNISLIRCSVEAHLTSFLITGSSSFFMPSHAAKAR